MRKIKYNLEIGFCGCNEEDEMEIDDDMSDEDISNMINNMANEYAVGWEGDTRLGWEDGMDEEEYDEVTERYYEGVYGAWEFIDGE